MKKNFLLLICYDGSDFSGWQDTGQKRTVEKELRTALEKILDHHVTLQAASRTDAKVHARGQVVNFFTEDIKYSLEEFCYRLNRILPSDLRVLEIREMPLSFHPTTEAKGKTYIYQVCSDRFIDPFHRRYFWHFPYPLDLVKMQNVAKHLEGTHDFSAFCNHRKDLIEKDKVRTLYSVKVSRENLFFTFELKGDHFLYRMARNIVGTLCSVGSDKITQEAVFEGLLQKQNRTFMGITAPPHALFLEKVYYDF